MSSSEKKSTFFGGAAILAVGSIIVKLIGAVYKIPLMNILSDGAYADFNAAYNVYSLFLIISTAGLPVALSKTISEANTLGRQNQVRRVFSVAIKTFLVLGLASFIVMFFFGGPIASLVGDPAAIYCVKALSPSVLCVCVMSAFRGYYQGHSNMVPTAVSQIIEALGKLFVGLALAYLVFQLLKGQSESYRQQMAAAGAILGVSVGSVVALCFIVSHYLRERRRLGERRYSDRPDGSGDIFANILKLAIPITLGSAAISIVTLIDTSVVFSLLKKMFTDMPELITDAAKAQAAAANGIDPVLYMARSLKGIYDKCMAIYNLPSQLMVAITVSVIPAVSACLARHDRRGASQVSESSLRVGVLFAFPMGFGLCALGGPIMGLLAKGIDVSVAGPIMSVLGIATIFVCLMLICNSILQAHGFVNLPVFTVIIGGVIKVAVNYLLVGNYDINVKGAPVGTLCCFAVVSVLDLWFIHRVIPLPPRYSRVFFKPLIAAAAMGGAVWACYGLLFKLLHSNTVATLGSIVVGVAVYAVLVILLKAISKDDLALMPKGDKIGKLLHII